MSGSRPPTSLSCGRPIRTLKSWPIPECPPEVIEVSHFTGSTAAMTDYVAQRKAAAGGVDYRMLDGR